MSTHRIMVSGEVTYISRDEDQKTAMFILNSRIVTPVQDEVRETHVDFYCFLTDPNTRFLTRFGKGAIVMAVGQFIGHPKWGSPVIDEDGTFSFKVEVNDVIVTSPKTIEDREDVVYINGLGKLRKDVKVSYTKTGTAFANLEFTAFHLTKNTLLGLNLPEDDAAYEVEPSASGWFKQPIGFRFSVWRNRTQIVESWKKGQQFYFESLNNLTVDPETNGPRSWTTEDGNARANLEGTLYNFDAAAASGDGAGAVPAGEDPYANQPSGDSDTIPF